MRHLKAKGRVAVVGAGLAGSCTALALARTGIDVLLLEQDHRPMNRASLRNEGKIHLGLIYANDPSLATSRLMLEGALSFARILRDLVGRSFDDVPRSTPFKYLVARDSLVGVDRLANHYEALQAVYNEHLETGCEYLGTKPDRLFRLLPERDWSRWFSPSSICAVFHTEELALNSDELAAAVRRALDETDRIEVLTGHTLEEVEKGSEGYALRGRNSDGDFTVDLEQVVNTTWERRATFDRQLGLEPGGPLLHRLKYRVIGELPESLFSGPSATMVLGRYGDVVVRSDGTAYLSWYPVGLQGWTNELEPPRSWDPPCRGNVDPELRERLIEGVISGIDAWYPGIREVRPTLVDAGAIVACGVTDVDDPASGLHERSDVGVTSVDGYHSVGSGKLTTAPMFALQAAQNVLVGLGVLGVSR